MCKTDDFEVTPSHSFRLGGSPKAVKAELQQDGFHLITIIDPLATPKISGTPRDKLTKRLGEMALRSTR